MPVNRQEYAVKLDLFEGPLDLLLYLVTRAEVNIVDISVSEVTAQYLSYLELMRDLNIDVAADYLHMAATLTYLKAHELLPPDATGTAGSEPEGDDGIYNREELVRQLLEYQKYKQAAGALKNFEAEQIHLFKRGIPEQFEAVDEKDGVDLGSLSMFDLLSAFKLVVERAQKEEEFRHVVNMDMVRIDDRIDRILTMVSDQDEVAFEELFRDDFRKMVIVVTFMAILELIKMQEICFRQEERFGSIFVLRRERKDRVIDVQTQRAAEAPPEEQDEKGEIE
ncbi:MAG: segregation/condensation protein A [Chitinispirillaceae bacterium]|jgi:segregation and condensation protein A|nr:segregation/condensation protein A [Chitinispirillaceae bacterium]